MAIATAKRGKLTVESFDGIAVFATRKCTAGPLVRQEGDIFQSMGDKHICPTKPNEVLL